VVRGGVPVDAHAVRVKARGGRVVGQWGVVGRWAGSGVGQRCGVCGGVVGAGVQRAVRSGKRKVQAPARVWR